MRWKNYRLMVLVLFLGLFVAGLTASYGQEKVSVQMTKEEAAQFRINKIQVELNQINAELRKKNQVEFKRIDELISEAQKIQAEAPPPVQAPAAPVPAKKK
jgi:hypothetical protein